MSRRLTVPSLLAAMATLGVIAPVSFTRAGGLEAATAECASCCAQPGATCVVCGTESCVSHAGYYQGKIGPGACELEN